MVHSWSVVPHLQTPFFMEADLLVRLGAQLDMVSPVLWSQADAGKHPPSLATLGLLLSGWVITAIISHIMYRHIKTLQTRLVTFLFFFLPLFRSVPLVNSCNNLKATKNVISCLDIRM